MCDAKLVTAMTLLLMHCFASFYRFPFLPIYHFHRESHIPLFSQRFESISN